MKLLCVMIPYSIERLIAYIMKSNADIHINEYGSGADLLAAMESKEFSAIFLDIQMQGMDGNDTAKNIRKKDMNLVLVFYTGYVEPSPISFEVQPYRYIMKNMTEEKIQEYVDAAIQKMKANAEVPKLRVYAGKVEMLIQAEHITYIEKYKRKTRVHLAKQAERLYDIPKEKDGKPVAIQLNQRLGVTYENLKRFGFGWPHDSYIINFSYLCSSTSKKMRLAEIDEDFQVTRSKAKEFNELKKLYMQEKYVKKGTKG